MVALTFCSIDITTSTPKPYGYPEKVETIGDHIRAKRIDLGMPQRLLCARIGCAYSSLVSWELNRAEPARWFMPKIIDFLGFDPLPKPEGPLERLERYRLVQGWDIPTTSAALGVYRNTVQGWLAGDHKPTARNLKRVEAFLQAESVP